MAVLLVLLNEIAERDVITRGILDASKDALGAELGKELPGELGVNADGNVIGKDGRSSSSCRMRKCSSTSVMPCRA